MAVTGLPFWALDKYPPLASADLPSRTILEQPSLDLKGRISALSRALTHVQRCTTDYLYADDQSRQLKTIVHLAVISKLDDFCTGVLKIR